MHQPTQPITVAHAVHSRLSLLLMMVLSGCRLSTAPIAASVDDATPSLDSGVAATVTGSSAAEAGNALAVPPPAANGGSPATPTSVVAAAPPMQDQAGSTGRLDDDAGAAPNQAGSSAPPVQLDQCNADLAACLIAMPLSYAECLRTNSEHGCAPPVTMTPPSTVLDATGQPISQVCQAELATCLTRLPTPEGTASCTEMARKCKS